MENTLPIKWLFSREKEKVFSSSRLQIDSSLMELRSLPVLREETASDRRPDSLLGDSPVGGGCQKNLRARKSTGLEVTECN